MRQVLDMVSLKEKNISLCLSLGSDGMITLCVCVCICSCICTSVFNHRLRSFLVSEDILAGPHYVARLSEG